MSLIPVFRCRLFSGNKDSFGLGPTRGSETSSSAGDGRVAASPSVRGGGGLTFEKSSDHAECGTPGKATFSINLTDSNYLQPEPSTHQVPLTPQRCRNTIPCGSSCTGVSHHERGEGVSLRTPGQRPVLT